MTYDSIELCKCVPLNEFQFVGGETLFRKIAIPTEIVVVETAIYEPEYARVYATNLYAVGDKVVDHEGTKSFSKGEYENVILVEVWKDMGYDGHLDYYHMGYRYVTYQQFSDEMANIVYGHLPYCICWESKNDRYPIDQWKEDAKYKKEIMS